MKIFVGCSSKDEINKNFIEDAKYIASNISNDNDLIFGGSNIGLMGVMYRAFKAKNRKITGICYPMYKDAYREVILDKEIIAHKLGEGIQRSIEEADTILILPGGYGTFIELIMSLELKKANKWNKKIVIYNCDHYFDDILKNFHTAYLNKAVNIECDDICIICTTKEETVEAIKK